MADRSIVVRLRAQADGFKSEMAAAAAAAEKVGVAGEKSAQRASTATGRLAQSATQHRDAWTGAGTVLTGFGAAALGALGMATKAAMDWESSWAGVMKTVDASPAQYAQLEQGLRGLARTLPSTHEEIAAVAEAAGQLGIQREAIVGFTRTMIDLGQTTNLSADEAATSIAQFSNVMGTSSNDISRFGAALVDLGNHGASTEKDIMMMAQRLAGSGKLIGASEQDILGLSAALADVGISAEAGGGSISRVLQKMNTAVLDGGAKLEGFAQTAGVSAEEFAAKWKSSPIEAFNMFVVGLGKVTQSGGNAVGVLKSLKVNSEEETRAMLSLAGAGDHVTEMLGIANNGWDASSALVIEASKRYDTAASKIAIARNNLVDLGIDIGGMVLPAVAALAEKGVGLIHWIQNLPGPAKEAGAVLGGLAGAASLGAGAFLLIVPRVLDTVHAFRQLREDGSRIPGVMGAIGKAALGLTALAAAPGIIKSTTDAMRGLDRSDFSVGTNQLTASLLNAAKSGSVFKNTLGDLQSAGVLNTEMFANLGASIESAANPDLADRFAVWSHLDGTGLAEVQERFDGLGQSLAVMAQTDLPKAQETFSAFWKEAQAGGASFGDILKVMPAFKDQLVGIATQMGTATDDATLLKIATGQIKPATDSAAVGTDGLGDSMSEASKEAKEMKDAITEMANTFLGQRGAMRDYEAALDAASDSIKKNGRNLGEHTEKGRANEAALDQLGRSALDVAEKMRASGEAPGKFLEGARKEIIATGQAMGRSKEDAEAYADQLGLTPEYIKTQIDVDTAGAEKKINSYSDLITQKVQKVVQQKIAVDTKDPNHQIKGFAGTMQDAGKMKAVSVPVTADTRPAMTKLEQFNARTARTTSTTNVDANARPAVRQLEGFKAQANGATGQVVVTATTDAARQSLATLQQAISGSQGFVTINGRIVNAQSALSALMDQVASSNGTVTINGQAVPASQALSTLIGQINAGHGTVTIAGNANPANAATASAVNKANSSTGTVKVAGNNAPAKAATSAAVQNANSSTGTVRVAGNNAPAKASADAATNYASGKSGTIHVGANTYAANSAINSAARDRNMTIRVHYSDPGFHGAASSSRFASGGPVYGPGTSTSDSIPASLSNGEHVMTAREVAQAGGQAAIFRMRRAISMGELKFSSGGGIERGTYAPAPVMQPSQVIVRQAHQQAFPKHIALVDADGTFLGRLRTVATDVAVDVVNAR